MPAMPYPDRCDGSDMPSVRDHAIEPGSSGERWRESGTEHVAPRRPDNELVAKAEAIARDSDWERRGTYGDYLRKLAPAWTEVFGCNITPERAAVALATLELLRANHYGIG